MVGADYNCPVQLILVRHAEPERIVETAGPADPPLTDRGRAQAQRVADYLGEESIDAVWSSPMRRARETADPIAERLGLTVLVDGELAEYDQAATSYIPLAEVKAADPSGWAAMMEASLAEQTGDPAAFQAGVVTAMEHLVTGNPGGTIAVVCHGGVINVYLAHVLGVTGRSLWFEPRYTSIHRVLASRRGDRTLDALNEVAHLRGTDLAG